MDLFWRNLGLRHVSVAVAAAIFVVFLVAGLGKGLGAQVGPSKPIGDVNAERHRVSPEEAQILSDELTELRRQVSALEERKGVDSGKVSELKNRMNEFEMRLREWLAGNRYRDSLAETNERFTSESLALATTWIHWVTILFTVVVAALGLGNFLESRQLKKEFESDRVELKKEVNNALVSMNKSRDYISSEIGEFKDEIDIQRLSSERTRAFVQAVAERFFGDTLLELLGALHKGGALSAATDKELRNKTKEIEARLFLRYPDPKRAEQAIRSLMALGSEAALPDLSEFASEIATGPELKMLAHQAMMRISERRGAAKGRVR
ncbi:MAG TPA: hypothetical protein VGP73_24765 [Thermoanaerobaculia bacterium]